MKHKTYFLVFLQILLMVAFPFTGQFVARNFILRLIETFGGVLAVWSIAVMMRHSRFSGFPEPKQGAKLLDRGPYRYIRNPMYSSILLVMAVVTIDHFTLLRLAIFVLEAAVLISKIKVEESLLPHAFRGYAEYKKRTRRLIPFIY